MLSSIFQTTDRLIKGRTQSCMRIRSIWHLPSILLRALRRIGCPRRPSKPSSETTSRISFLSDLEKALRLIDGWIEDYTTSIPTSRSRWVSYRSSLALN